MRPVKAQTSLRICTAWSEPSLVAWIFYDDGISFGVSKLKKRLHRLLLSPSTFVKIPGWKAHVAAHLSRDMRLPQCGMCDQQSLRSASALIFYESLLTEHHLEFLSLTGGCTGLSESTLVKIPHCWRSHVAAHLLLFVWKLDTCKISIYYLASVAEQAGLSFA